MKIVISGATGLIGSILADQLWNQFHTLVLLSRKPPAETCVRKKEWFAWNPPAAGVWETAIDGADGVINLAGELIAGKRWSEPQKALLRSSRIDATRALVNAMTKAKNKPKFFISGSAVGYYGTHGDETITEKNAPGSGFLAQLCIDWEAEANKAEEIGSQGYAIGHRHRARSRSGRIGQNGAPIQNVFGWSVGLRCTVAAVDSYRRRDRIVAFLGGKR